MEIPVHRALEQFLDTIQSWHNACMILHAPQDRSRNTSMAGSKADSACTVSMSTILHLPTPAKGRSQAPIQESAAQETVIYRSQTERIAHDLKNCMSVLLLAISSLQDNQPLISESRKRVLEDVVEEMNRLVDEMVRLGEGR